MRILHGAKRLNQAALPGRQPTSEAIDRARIIPWPLNRWTMADNACQQDDPAEPRSVFRGKKIRPHHAALPVDSTARSPRPPARSMRRSARYCDHAPMSDDQRELAVRYIPMAQALARRAVWLGPSESEELQSAAYMALVEAASTFDPSRKVNFATYARHRIRGALRDCRRLLLIAASWRGDPARPLVFQAQKADLEELGRVLGAKPEPPVGAEIESTEAVEKWLRRLPRAQAAACRLIYLHGKSHDEAATLLGCSKSYVSRLHRDAISRLIQDYHAACGSQRPAYPPDEA